MAGLRILSMMLYSSLDWKNKELGSKGEFGGDLGIPAVSICHDVAPYPF